MYHDYNFELTGKITFDPIDLTKKHVKQSGWKNTVIILIDNIDFCKYYCWFINKRYNLELQMPQRGLHFTIINDKISDKQKYNLAKKTYNNKILTLEYSVDPRTKNNHWWLPTKSEDAEMIRIACGLEPKPFWGFHLTIGRTDEHNIHNNYIQKIINNEQANEFYIQTLINKRILKYNKGLFI